MLVLQTKPTLYNVYCTFYNVYFVCNFILIHLNYNICAITIDIILVMTLTMAITII